MITALKALFRSQIPEAAPKPSPEAYDAWAGTYDMQPDNLMLHLDELLFSSLLQNVQLLNKKIADIGCGTGRHWKKMYDADPLVLTGYDVSEGMLLQLQKKFPSAKTVHCTNALLNEQNPASVDCIISTLTVAHIENITEALESWAAALAVGGDMIITDFHPAMLANGGRRTFTVEGKNLSVINHVHSIDEIVRWLGGFGIILLKREEKYVNEEVKNWYAKQNAMRVYEKFKGQPVIYGLHLKKIYAPQ
jgi:ubiquinone/menaquinone biosynthesis C-methylase UbiE